LNLLRDLTRAGHSIGTVATLSTARLRKLAAESTNGASNLALLPSRQGPSAKRSFLEEGVMAVRQLDAPALEDMLNRAATEVGSQGLLQRVIAPLAQTIGELWRESEITAAHEHFASAVIRVFLGHTAKSFTAAQDAPVLVVGTPAGQLHELGALLAAAAAANLGWNVTYLGPSLPAAEIAGAARQNHARAVALSIVYPEDDPRLENELTRLRALLPETVPLLAGGRAMAAYGEILEKLGALPMKDLDHLCATLDSLRKSPRKPVR
jgi:methanogenic corrinoid protein MtbC1